MRLKTGGAESTALAIILERRFGSLDEVKMEFNVKQCGRWVCCLVEVEITYHTLGSHFVASIVHRVESP